MSDGLFDRFAQMPRAFRWLIFAVTFILLFTVWNGAVGPVAAAWNRDADKILSKAQTVERSAELRRQLGRLEETVMSIGPVRKPGHEDTGRLELSDTVVAVLGDKQNDWDLGGGGDKLRDDISRGIVSAGNRLIRISGTVKFVASPDEAIRIIADLETRPEVEAIRKVSLNRASSGKREVDVNLVIEAWVEVPPIKRRL